MTVSFTLPNDQGERVTHRVHNSVFIVCDGQSHTYPLEELARQAWATLGEEGFDTRDTYTDEAGDWRQSIELCALWNPDGLDVAWRMNRRNAGHHVTRESRLGVIRLTKSDMADLLAHGATLQQIVTAAARQLAHWKQGEGFPLQPEAEKAVEVRRFKWEVE